MRKLFHYIINNAARRSIEKRCELIVSPSARVNYRGIRHRPPSKLTIGDGTIFDGRIASDRDESIISIGENTFIGGSLLVCAERIEIGDDVLISWGCTIVDHNSHAISWEYRKNDVKDTFHGKKDWSHVNVQPVFIKNKSWIGFNVIILKGVTIGEGSIVAAGSVVAKDVPPYTIFAGNPARLIREIPLEDR